MTFLEAIARMEGFYTQGTIPQRNNNPGDIEFGKFAESYHGIPGDPPRFARFPDAATGFTAMKALLSGPRYKGKTVAQVLNIYAPPVENATNHYIATVCGWVGCEPTDIIDPLVEAS